MSWTVISSRIPLGRWWGTLAFGLTAGDTVDTFVGSSKSRTLGTLITIPSTMVSTVPTLRI